MHTPEERLVIQMILQGQHHAYAVLVDRYQAYVFTLAMRYVHNREEAEELAQDIFVKAFHSLPDFKGDSKFSTWLYTIVHRTCLSYLRKKRPETILLEQEQIILLSAHRQTNENADSNLEIKTRKVLLDKAINNIPAQDAEIITLFYIAEQSLQEISEILNITTNSAKVKLYRARQKLREILETKFMNELI